MEVSEFLSSCHIPVRFGWGSRCCLHGVAWWLVFLRTWDVRRWWFRSRGNIWFMAVCKSTLLKFVAEYLNIITRSDRPGQKQGVRDKHGPDQQ